MPQFQLASQMADEEGSSFGAEVTLTRGTILPFVPDLSSHAAAGLYNFLHEILLDTSQTSNLTVLSHGEAHGPHGHHLYCGVTSVLRKLTGVPTQQSVAYTLHWKVKSSDFL